MFAEQQGYPESETVKALTRAVKAMAIASQLEQPGAILLLYHVFHRLDHVPLSSVVQFCRELRTECPAFINASPNFRDQLFQYLHCRHVIARTICGVQFMSRRAGDTEARTRQSLKSLSSHPVHFETPVFTVPYIHM